MDSNMYSISATYFYDDITPHVVKKELTPYIIVDTISEFINNQYEYIFGVKPDNKVLIMLTEGYILFNLHKNRYMLNNKTELLKYISNKSISIEEKEYFKDIFLFIQRPKFLSDDEHEYIRACGDLNGYNKN